MRGLIHPRECEDCRAVVTVFEELDVYRAERLERGGVTPAEIDRRLDEPLEERCPECGGTRLKPWSDDDQEARADEGLPLKLDPCPKCAGQMKSTGVVGIVD